ncbi:MAG: hypothetical protein IBX56_08585 [Methylomicrobium sp.]|nr:hypothetical protein [Methylomicrobium sp.]
MAHPMEAETGRAALDAASGTQRAKARRAKPRARSAKILAPPVSGHRSGSEGGTETGGAKIGASRKNKSPIEDSHKGYPGTNT